MSIYDIRTQKGLWDTDTTATIAWKIYLQIIPRVFVDHVYIIESTVRYLAGFPPKET